MTEQPTTRTAFAKRAERWNDKAPVFAEMCRAVADDPELAACVDDSPVVAVAGRPQHTSVWSRPHLLAGLVTRLLRTKASGHELARYWATLGGRKADDVSAVAQRRDGDGVASGEAHDGDGSLAKRPPDDGADDGEGSAAVKRPSDDGALGADSAFAAAFRDFARRYRAELAELAAAHPKPRGNDPLVAVMLWPGIAWAAAEAAGPVAFLELGSAAGTCLFADRYGYRYGDRRIGGERPLVLETGWDGELPDFLAADVDVVSRVGLEYEPVRRADADAIAWLRDCVLPDNADELARLDGALSVMEPGGVDWRAGDYMETLPKALSDVPDGVTPIVFGASTLCCVADGERLPRILAECGRDLVWIAKEHADRALGLVSDAAAEYEEADGTPPPVLVTAVSYRAGRASGAWVLGRSDQWNASLAWAPRQVALR